MFMSPWARQEQYSRLLEALEGMGYNFDLTLPEVQRNAYTFDYDWRQDIRIWAGCSVRRSSAGTCSTMAHPPG